MNRHIVAEQQTQRDERLDGVVAGDIGIVDVLQIRPDSVLTPAQIATAKLAQNRRLNLKVWLLLALPAEEMARLMTAPMPPSIAQLYQRARKHAEANAGRCASCGAAQPIEGATTKAKKRPKKRKKRVIPTP